MTRSPLVSLAAGVFVLATLAPAIADAPGRTYATDDKLHHWGVDSITIRFVKNGWWSERDEAIARQGFSVWNRVRDAYDRPLVTIREADPDVRADLTIRFAPLGKGDRSPEALRVGLTQTSYLPRERRIVAAQMRLTPLVGLRWYGESDAETTAAHEMGHALGIATHSPNARDLMNDRSNSELSAADIETLKRAYVSRR